MINGILVDAEGNPKNESDPIPVSTDATNSANIQAGLVPDTEPSKGEVAAAVALDPNAPVSTDFEDPQELARAQALHTAEVVGTIKQNRKIVDPGA